MTDLKRVLHVEDDEDIQEITRLALEVVGGMELAQFFDGPKALESIEGFQPDLILLDQMMPIMTGEEVLHQLRQMPAFRKTPAVFMTAQSAVASEMLMKNTDALEIIPKPFNPMTLAAQLTKIWESRCSGAE